MCVIVLYFPFPKHGALAQRAVTPANQRCWAQRDEQIEDSGGFWTPSIPFLPSECVEEQFPQFILPKGCAVAFLYGRWLNNGVCKLVATNKYQIGLDPSSVSWSCFVLLHVYCHNFFTETTRNKSRDSQPDYTLNSLKNPTTRPNLSL